MTVQDRQHALLELLCEGLVVEQYPWIVVLVIVAILDRLHTGNNTIDVFISAQHHERGIRALGVVHCWERGATRNR